MFQQAMTTAKKRVFELSSNCGISSSSWSADGDREGVMDSTTTTTNKEYDGSPQEYYYQQQKQRIHTMNQQVADLDVATTRKKFLWEEAMIQMKELKKERDDAQIEFDQYIHTSNSKSSCVIADDHNNNNNNNNNNSNSNNNNNDVDDYYTSCDYTLTDDNKKDESSSKKFQEADGMTFFSSFVDRSKWLVGLLLLQSGSSFILARHEALLQNHTVIMEFLTMLVGAGGNAGNQSSIRIIRGLAVGSIHPANLFSYIRREFWTMVLLCLALGGAGYIRSVIFRIPLFETIAITSSLVIIVASSIVIGTALPLAMKSVGIDPAHSSPTIQVLMDILGVTVVVQISTLILEGDNQNA